jgi:hypothetical protein
MGLDMYLSKKTYVKQWEHQSPEEKYEVVVTKGGQPVDGIKAGRVKYIEEEVGYWRKANQIHKWFVDNVQNGEDDCGDYYVEIDDLMNLLDVCKQVKDDPSKAEQLLPPQSGFFFGGTEIDEYYMRDIEHTIEILESILSEKVTNSQGREYLSGEFYYQSSW